jgi:ligand-binding sensor domain-containing protein
VPGLSIAFAPSNPSIAYLGTSGGGLYRSQDGGATWSPWALSGKVVLSTAVKPDNPNVLYASTSDAGVVQYYNGSSWQSINFPGGGTVNVLIYSDPSTVWAGSTNGVYKRVGSGSWTAAGLSNYTLRDLTLDPHRAGRLWAGTSNGAFYSDDGGITWQNGPADLAGRIILKISFDPNSPDYVYFATDSFGAYRALDP